MKCGPQAGGDVPLRTPGSGVTHAPGARLSAARPSPNPPLQVPGRSAGRRSPAAPTAGPSARRPQAAAPEPSSHSRSTHSPPLKTTTSCRRTHAPGVGLPSPPPPATPGPNAPRLLTWAQQAFHLPSRQGTLKALPRAVPAGPRTQDHPSTTFYPQPPHTLGLPLAVAPEPTQPRDGCHWLLGIPGKSFPVRLPLPRALTLQGLVHPELLT